MLAAVAEHKPMAPTGHSCPQAPARGGSGHKGSQRKVPGSWLSWAKEASWRRGPRARLEEVKSGPGRKGGRNSVCGLEVGEGASSQRLEGKRPEGGGAWLRGRQATAVKVSQVPGLQGGPPSHHHPTVSLGKPPACSGSCSCSGFPRQHCFHES